jgi:hypothetical protein
VELVPQDDSRQVVLFATPTFEKSVSTEYHESMMKTQLEMIRHGIPFAQALVAGNQFIDVVRNKLVHYFLTGEGYEGAHFTDLILIDADQGWDEKVIPRILRYKQGVVAALPPKKADIPMYHDNAITGVMQDGLFQAKEAGTGFMRIKREVFERMDKAFPELAQMVEPAMGWPHTPYFQRGNTKYGGWYGEDLFFCRQLIEMGEFVWIDSDVTFTHRGSRMWKGNFYDHCVEKGYLRKEAKSA